MAGKARAGSPYDITGDDYRAYLKADEGPSAPTPPNPGGVSLEEEPPVAPKMNPSTAVPGSMGSGGSEEERIESDLGGSKHGGRGGSKLPMAIGAVVVIAVIGILYLFVLSKPAPVTTTISQVSFNINSCTKISQPGTYVLTSGISTSLTTGGCIVINSSNVNLEGQGYGITGNGPYIDQPPYTYGVFVGTETNVTVSGLSVSKFSYGVYLSGTSNSRLTGLSVRNSTISGIYLDNARYNTLSQNRVTGTGAQYGGIDIAYGGNNTVESSSSDYNSYYGIRISNSTGNRLYNSSFIGNPTDLECAANSSLESSNRFVNSTCFVNDYCNFASCSQLNEQFNISQISLGSYINTCGSIDHPGSYTLTSNLNLANYLNLSLPASNSVPCIDVNASNVYLNCNGHTISNSHYAIMSNTQYNITLSGCNLQNNFYGVVLENVITFLLNRMNIYNGTYGVYIIGSTGGNLTSVTADRNTYGYYINSTTYLTATGFSLANNTYGVSVSNSSDVFFRGGTASTNSKVDFYCSADTYNSTQMSLTQSTCRSTDCNWAPSCPVKYLPGISAYPITGCTTITVAGDYQLENNIVAPASCFTIKASNVDINCDNKIVTGTAQGTAFSVLNSSNVALSNCRITRFSNGIYALNSGHLSVLSSSISSVLSGVQLFNSSNSDINGDTVSSFVNYAYQLNGTDGSVVTGDLAETGSASIGYGFALQKSNYNIVENDTSNVTAYGFYLGGSQNNTVTSNFGSGSQVYDYYCGPGSSSVISQPTGINFGSTKFGCKWMVETTPVPQQACQLFSSPQPVLLSEDMIYPYGDYCFSTTSNSLLSTSGTMINCNGHTVLATDGGKFLFSRNPGSLTLENCILIGFTEPVFVQSSKQSSYIAILNNTFLNSGTAIVMNNTMSSSIENNLVINATTGVELNEFNSSKLENNVFTKVGRGIVVNNSIDSQVINNTVDYSIEGLASGNLSGVSFGRNMLTGTGKGLYCSSSTSNLDLGGNVCSSTNGGCTWLSASASPSCSNGVSLKST